MSDSESRQALIEAARHCEFYQTALEGLGELLPEDDAELDAVLTEVVAKRDERAFCALYVAALGAGHRVDAKHLVKGGALLRGPDDLICGVRSCAGDVAGALLAAVQHGRMGNERESVALWLAWKWSADRGQAVPAGFWGTARGLARSTVENILVQCTLLALARLSQNQELAALLTINGQITALDPMAENTNQMFTGMYKGSIWEAVPRERPPKILSGYTVRRAVPRVGRNEPCPCGSGKKYKKCCFEKDQQRLLESSPVAGVTREEWRTYPELGLTIERLEEMRSYEVVKLDFAKVPAPLQGPLLDRLLMFKEYEAVLTALEVVGYQDRWGIHWNRTMYAAAANQNLGLLQRLVALRPGLDCSSLPLNVRLLFAGDTGATLLDLIETEARQGLSDGQNTVRLADLAYSLLESRAPSLGVLVARSILLLCHPLESEFLLDALLDTRDKLELSTDEPYIELVDEYVLKGLEEPPDSEALASLRNDLETKRDEVDRLRAELKDLYRQREKRQAPPTHTPTPTPSAATRPPEDRVPPEWRAKIEQLQAALKERHAERNQLRRELQAAQAQLAVARTSPESGAREVRFEDREDTLLLAESDMGTQPVRVPEFPRKFSQVAAGLPRPVVKAALLTAARLASGEPAAFAGVRPLRMWPEVYRQRVASDYRLLFRLTPERLEVVDLIHRRDLERTIKTRA